MRVIIDATDLGGLYYDPEAVGFAVDFEQIPTVVLGMRETADTLEGSYLGAMSVESEPEQVTA